MKKAILSLFLIAMMISCSKLDKPEQIPSFIYIDHIDLQTNYPQEGSNSHEILDAWVYLDDAPLGVFSLPARIPVLAEGAHKLTIFGGIKADGISSRRRRYPFYQPYILDNFELSAGETDTLQGSTQPVVTYYPQSLLYIWEDPDFEDVFVLFDQDPNDSDTSMGRTTDPAEVFEGTGAGVITLSSSQAQFKAVSNVSGMNAPKGGSPVYAELNYKGNNSFAVGVRCFNPGSINDFDNTIVKASYDDNGNLVWKKIYIELTEIVSFNLNASSTQLYFRMLKDEGVSVPYVLIDNVKLIYAL